MKFIYHHQGLGDHIICNGLVRHFSDLYDKITLFCKPNYLDNIKYMYRDTKKIEVISVGHDADVIKYIEKNRLENSLIKVGFENLRQSSLRSFDEEFYRICGLPFETRFSKFYLERDLDKEKKLFEFLNPKNEPYIFVHDVNLGKVRQDLKIIENPKQFNIFDLILLIENAEEVHLMESSVKNLVNSYKFDKPTFFYHQYVRKYGEFMNSKGLNEYITIY